MQICNFCFCPTPICLKIDKKCYFVSKPGIETMSTVSTALTINVSAIGVTDAIYFYLL